MVHIAESLLEEAHSSAVASGIFADKILHRPLHLRPTSPDPASQDARAKRRLQRLHKQEKLSRCRKVKPLSAKEKRDTGIYDIRDGAKKYEIYVPLHEMWLGYMREILALDSGPKGFINAQNAGSNLTSADYHGAQLTVVRSKCLGLVGLAGIVIRDSKFTFQIITKKDELKTIPKKHTIFRFEIQGAHAGNVTDLKPMVFELHGSQFEHRATDRATKKLKQRYLLEL